MTIYANGKATADRLLQRYGQAGTLRRLTIAMADPAGPVTGAGTVTEYPCRVAVFPIDQRDIDGTTIKAGDFRVIMSAVGLEEVAPTTTDRLICSEGEMVIVDPGKFAPAGTVTHYRMICRK